MCVFVIVCNFIDILCVVIGCIYWVSIYCGLFWSDCVVVVCIICVLMILNIV